MQHGSSNSSRYFVDISLLLLLVWTVVLLPLHTRLMLLMSSSKGRTDCSSALDIRIIFAIIMSYNACFTFNILLLMRVSATAVAGIAVSFAYWKHNNLFTILSQKIVLGKHIFPLESSWRLFEIFRLPNFYEQFLITIWNGESKIGTKLRKLQESCFAFPQLWVCSQVTYYTSYGKTHLLATSSACFSLSLRKS